MLWPEANIKSNTGWAVVVVDTCLNPLCSNVHITSPPLTNACPNRTTNGCRPAVFNMVWDCAWLLSLLWKSTVTNAVQPDKKRHRPLMLRPPRAGTKCDAATHKLEGYQPHCAHTPSAGAVTGRPSGIRSPSRLWSRRGYLLRARERGRAWDGGVGLGFGGWGGQHRSILGWWGIIIVFRLTLSLTITKPLADILCISMCVIPQKKKRSSGCVVLASNLHTRTLQASTHSVFLTNTHSPYRHTVITTGASQQTYTSDCVCGTALPSRLCVGGTEPQALSVSIAHVKSHVGCDEPPTIPGTITRRNRGRGSFRRPPRIAGWRRMPGLSSC